MSELLAILSVLSLFIIRLGIPLLLLIIVSYTLHRLEAAWRQAPVAA
jgi:hypothetical protein